MSERTIKTRIAPMTGIIRGLQHLGASPMPVPIHSTKTPFELRTATQRHGLLREWNRLGVFNDNHDELSDDDYLIPRCTRLPRKGCEALERRRSELAYDTKGTPLF